MKGSTWLCWLSTLPKTSRSLPILARKPPGRVGKVTKPSSTPISSGPIGEEEVGARIRIHDGLEAQLGLVQLQRGLGALPLVSHGTQEVADDRDVGVEDLGAGRGVVARNGAGGFGCGQARRNGRTLGRRGRGNRCGRRSRRGLGYRCARRGRGLKRFYLGGQLRHLLLERRELGPQRRDVFGRSRRLGPDHDRQAGQESRQEKDVPPRHDCAHGTSRKGEDDERDETHPGASEKTLRPAGIGP